MLYIGLNFLVWTSLLKKLVTCSLLLTMIFALLLESQITQKSKSVITISQMSKIYLKQCAWASLDAC
jgi:hypothetical protein